MNRILFALILSLFAHTAFAEDNPLGVRGRAEPSPPKPVVVPEEKKVEPPPATTLPAPATTTDAGKDTPEQAPTACTLPPLTMPVQFTALIRDELTITNRNNAAVAAYGEIYKVWTQKKADYDICKINKKDCKDPGKMPAQPKMTASFLDYLFKPGNEQANVVFHGNVGNWLICAELNRARALESCQKGNPTAFEILERELKKTCPLVIDRRRR